MLAIITSQRQKMEPHTKHTHTRTENTLTFSHTHSHTHICTHKHTNTHIHSNTYTNTKTHILTHPVLSFLCVCVCVSLYVCMCVYIKRVTQTQIQKEKFSDIRYWSTPLTCNQTAASKRLFLDAALDRLLQLVLHCPMLNWITDNRISRLL